MARPTLALLLAGFWSTGCAAAGPVPTSEPAFDPATGAPPSAKEALQLLIRNHDVPLAVDPSCQGVGTEFSDRTIGDYISGFLAELTGPDSSVAATCDPLSTPGGPGQWRCDVVLSHADGAEEWRWGVRFDVDAAGMLERHSVRCTGMG